MQYAIIVIVHRISLNASDFEEKLEDLEKKPQCSGVSRPTQRDFLKSVK